jgi:hypothetical protein
VPYSEGFVRALPIACAFLLIRFVTLEARYRTAKRVSNGTVFPVGIGLRIVFRCGGPFLIFVAYKMTHEAANAFDWAMALLVAGLGFASFLLEPGEIRIGNAGLTQRSILGLKTRVVSWSGSVASVPRGGRDVLVIGTDGTTITHSQYHVAQSQFVHELKTHGVFLQE